MENIIKNNYVLKININTIVPGHTRIKYRPHMNYPKASEKYILFNPFVKLDKYIINSASKEDLYDQFYDRTKFISLLNRTLTTKSQKPINTLDEAIQSGVIDNNIKLVLNTLFKENNKFILYDKNYLVYKYEWNNDWYIENKKTKSTTKKNKTIKGGASNYYFNYYSNPQTKKNKKTLLQKNRPSINITIFLSLVEKGKMDNIPYSLKSKITCNDRYERIRKSYSNLLGYVYVPVEKKFASIVSIKQNEEVNK